ncbi:MAG: T9SS type A sorting domain-containing protein, partial [Flavobacteriales bacterium]|nr:T9SS type A sorting domain-containing protein [Flavobacteriales bacterium]
SNLISETKNEKYSNYIYTQTYKGLEVLDSRLYVKTKLTNEVVVFGLDVFPNISLSINSTVSNSDAILSASSNLPFSVSESRVEDKMKILPIPKKVRYEYHLVKVVHLSTKNHIGPAEYLCYVDANTGELLMRKNDIKFESLQANIHVEGEVYTTNPFNSSSIVDLVDLKVRHNNIDYYTDSSGQVILPSNNGNATYYLEGLYSEVRTNGNIPSFNAPASNNNILFDNTTSTISERTAFYAVNNIHSHFKSQFPTFNGLDFPIETNVDISTANCNAYYSSGTVNFYAEGGGCQSTANIPDVAYHEYGHAINDYRYNAGAGMWNGGLNEGTADIWALSLTQYPVLGEGWYLNDPNSNVREYDSILKVYPQDLVGEVHADGEIICGAFWRTYENLGSMQQALDLFIDLYDAGPDGPNGTEGIIYTDILVEFLYSDDNDGNIFNGTPNDLAIVDAFAQHGITLLSNAVLTHTELDESLQSVNIDVDANITLTYPWALDNAYCYYKVNNSNLWDSIPLSVVSGNDYSAQIPMQNSGTVVAYYLSLTDVYGKKAAVTPFSAHLDKHPNLPYFILVGYELEEEQDFDFNIGFWDVSHPSDNATTGLWEIGVPEGTFYDNIVPVQTPSQHTFQGAYCAFTGNDFTGGSIGANDVDGGHTTLTSPIYDLTDYTNPTFAYYRWYTNSPPTGANPNADWWQVQVTDDGVNWVYVENNMTSDNRWRKFSFRVKDYVNINSDFRMRFIASDSIRLGQNLDGGSLVEAAVDDVYLYDENIVSSTEDIIANIDVFPNPTKGIVYFDLDKEYQIKVVNVLGEEILSKKLNVTENTIDLTEFSDGIYYIKLYNDKFIETKKIILK